MSKNKTRYERHVSQETPTDPRARHHYYETWLEQQSYLKRNLDEACIKIADLIVENKNLKEEIKELRLPFGQRNKLR